MNPFTASKFAEYPELNTPDLPEGSDLNEVACHYRGKPLEIDVSLKTFWAETVPLPDSEPLLRLADIRPISLFASTKFDSSRASAINEKRLGGNPRTVLLAYSQDKTEDVPGSFGVYDNG